MTWPAFAAAAWAVQFAAVSLFWGLGGGFGFYFEDVLADDPSTATVNWIAMGLKYEVPSTSRTPIEASTV